MAKHWDSFLSYCIWLRWVMFTRSTSQFFWVRIYYYYYVQSIQLIWKEERKSFFPHYTATSFLPLLCNAYCYVIPPNLLLFGHKLSLCSSLLHFFFRKILFCWGIVYILRKWSLCYWKQNMLQMVNFFLLSSISSFPLTRNNTPSSPNPLPNCGLGFLILTYTTYHVKLLTLTYNA